MRTHPLRSTKLRKPDAPQPRQRLLGLAVLLLTFGGAYAVGQRGAVPPPVGIVAVAQEADAETSEPEAPHAPTAAEIMMHIDDVAARYNVPARLVAAIVAVESEFNPHAVSRRGAQGLMQLMPATAASLDVQDSFDLQENLDAGVRHLRVLMERYHNDLVLVLAAYNAGDRAVLVYRGVPPYPQTRRYVIRVLRRYDPEAAHAAAIRIYGARPVAAPPAPPLPWRFVSLDSPAPIGRPESLGPWREEKAAPTRVMDPPRAMESTTAHGANSP
jgi:hypothetical protein